MKPKFFGKYSAIKAGNRGLVVYLPTAFTKLNDIKPGTQISIYLVEDSSRHLMIEAPKGKEKKS